MALCASGGVAKEVLKGLAPVGVLGTCVVKDEPPLANALQYTGEEQMPLVTELGDEQSSGTEVHLATL